MKQILQRRGWVAGGQGTRSVEVTRRLEVKENILCFSLLFPVTLSLPAGPGIKDGGPEPV